MLERGALGSEWYFGAVVVDAALMPAGQLPTLTVMTGRLSAQRHVRDVWYTKAPLAVRCQVASCGREIVTDETYNWEGQRREETPYVIVKITTDGQGMYRYGTDTVAVEPGTLMVVPIPHDNRYWLPPDHNWSFSWVCLYGADAVQAAQAIIAARGPVVPIVATDLVVTAVERICTAFLADEALSAFAASGLAYQVVMGLMELADARDHARSPAIHAACHFAQTHLHERIGVAEMARAAKVTRHHFSRLFTAEMGVTPIDWLSLRRCELAADLLRKGQSIDAVRITCGYSDVSYFGKVFRKHFGLSPGAFRDTGRFGLRNDPV